MGTRERKLKVFKVRVRSLLSLTSKEIREGSRDGIKSAQHTSPNSARPPECTALA